MDERLSRQIGGARWLLALTIALGVTPMLATIAQMLFLGRIVALVVIAHAGLPRLSPLLILLAVIVLCRALLVWLEDAVARLVGIHVVAELRRRLFAHLLRLGPAYTAGERTGELVTTATDGVDRLEPYVARYLPQKTLSVLLPLLVAAAVAAEDRLSAVLLIATAPVIVVLLAVVGGSSERRIERQWVGLSRMGAHFLDAVQGLPTLLSFDRGHDERKRIGLMSADYRDRTMAVLRVAFLSALVLEFLTGVAIGVVAVELGVRLLSGNVTFDRALTVLLLAPEFYRPLRELGLHRHAGLEGAVAARRIAEILATPALAAAVPVTSRRPPARPTILFDAVSFVYPGTERPALDAVRLVLPAGSRTAIVGPTGAGKSTLVHLLLRFLDPTSGSILADGVRLVELSPEQWRERVALVPQRASLFAGTISDNIAIARPTASRADIERAASLAGATDFIARAPLGYATQIGERGSRLSGGEVQRIALARAFLKDAPIVVLDEPTAHLDHESETLVRTAIEQLLPGRTVLIIAHRLRTVRDADQIAVLNGGRLVDRGTHAELLDRDGIYRDLLRPVARVPA